MQWRAVLHPPSLFFHPPSNLRYLCAVCVMRARKSRRLSGTTEPNTASRSAPLSLPKVPPTAVGGTLGKLSGADRDAVFGSVVPDSRRDFLARITHTAHK